jgi:hypothetical protein
MAEDAVVYRADHAAIANDTPPEMMPFQGRRPVFLTHGSTSERFHSLRVDQTMPDDLSGAGKRYGWLSEPQRVLVTVPARDSCMRLKRHEWGTHPLSSTNI